MSGVRRLKDVEFTTSQRHSDLLRLEDVCLATL